MCYLEGHCSLAIKSWRPCWKVFCHDWGDYEEDTFGPGLLCQVCWTSLWCSFWRYGFRLRSCGYPWYRCFVNHRWKRWIDHEYVAEISVVIGTPLYMRYIFINLLFKQWWQQWPVLLGSKIRTYVVTVNWIMTRDGNYMTIWEEIRYRKKMNICTYYLRVHPSAFQEREVDLGLRVGTYTS